MAQRHLELAALYLLPKNPGYDYQQAYNFLSQAVTLEPALHERYGVELWLAALFQMQRQQERLLKLQTELSLQQQQKQALTAELATLKATLEQVKRLDVSLERKRREFRQ